MFGFGTKKICTSCGTVAIPETKARGNLLIEIILWLMLIVPGLIYSIWRISSKYDVCPECDTEKPITLKSPRGKKLLEEFHG